MVKPRSSKRKKDAPSKKEIRKKTRKELRKIRSTIKQLGKPEDLRKFRIFLSKIDLNIGTIQALTKFQNLLDKANVSVEEFENALNLLNKYEITLASFLSLIENIESLKAKYGKPYTALVKDYQSEMEKIAKAASRLKQMEGAEKDLENRIASLKDLEALQGSLAQHGVSVEQIVEYIGQHKRLSQFGFDLNTVKIIAEELKRLQIDPEEAGKIVGSWLANNKTIDEALRKIEIELEESKKELEESKKELEESKKELEESKKDEALTIGRLKSLEQKAIESQKKIDSLESDYFRRSESLENEYKNKEHVLAERLDQESKRAEAESLEILPDSYKLRNENQILKEEAEAIRKEVELVRSISIILRDPKALSAAQLDTLVSEFMKASETTEKAEAGSSLERLIEARRVLLTALRKWSLVISR